MLHRICNILSTIILVVLAVAAAMLILPNLTGFKCMAVLSGSMEPEISVGSIVYVKEVDAVELQAGDIISYSVGEEAVVTHRIESVDREQSQFTTKGDANDVADGSPVDFSRVIGRVIYHIPLLGYITIYAKTPLGITGLCVIIIVILLLMFLPDIFSKEKKSSE